MKTITQHLSAPAMIVACVALLLALGGVSYAAGVLPKNSVGTAQLKKKAVTRAKLKKNAVTGVKINKNAVTGVKVKNGTLLAADFKAGQLSAGPQGPKGDKGDPGIPGAKGEPGAAGSAVGYAHVIVTAGGAIVETSRSKNVTQANVSRRSQGITCLSGLPFTPKNVAVTTDAEMGNGIYNATSALVPDAGVIALCGSTSQVAVITGQGYNAYDTSYYVVFN